MTTPQPHPTDDLNQLMSPNPRYPDFDGWWRLTETTGCPAAIIHRALGCPSGSISRETLALFHEGYLHEDDIKARMRAKGMMVIEYGQEGLRATDIPIICHPDGYEPSTGEIVEIKSVGDVEDFRDAEQSIYDRHSGWTKQVQGYMRIAQAERARIIIKIRKNGWVLKPIVVPYDASITDPIWASVVQARNDILEAQKYLPPDQVTCDKVTTFLTCSDDYTTRMFCPFSSHCKKDNGVQGNEVVEKLLFDYAGWKTLYDECDSEMQVLRGKVREIVDNEKVTKIVTSVGDVSIVPRKAYTANYPDSEQMRITLKPGFQNIIKEMTRDTTAG